MNIQKGSVIDGYTVAEVGEIGGVDFNCPDMLPVLFQNGDYGVLVDWRGGGSWSLLTSENSECNELLRHSTTMPIARPGIGSDVLHVIVQNEQGKALLKFFYNEKGGRKDEIITQ